MPKLPGVGHKRAIAAFKKIGFKVVHKAGKHTSMSDGRIVITLPRHNPINPFILASTIKDVGLTVEEFKKLL